MFMNIQTHFHDENPTCNPRATVVTPRASSSSWSTFGFGCGIQVRVRAFSKVESSMMLTRFANRSPEKRHSAALSGIHGSLLSLLQLPRCNAGSFGQTDKNGARPGIPRVHECRSRQRAREKATGRRQVQTEGKIGFFTGLGPSLLAKRVHSSILEYYCRY